MKSFLNVAFASLLLCLFAWGSQAGAPALQPWIWLQSDCQSCPLFISIENEELNTTKVREFIRALESSKFELVSLYQSDPQEYNLLAHMAVGILGRESKFFRSWRYQAKENLQWAVSLVKTVRVYLSEEEDFVEVNSRGPTQIKIIPAKIAEVYNITPDQLKNPTAAARATMGYLIEALKELKKRAQNNNWEFVNEQTYSDYLPYIYFGASRKLRDRSATPDKNLYIKAMREYMSWVKLYELPPLEKDLALPQF
jgi:hypothetical protein